MTSPLIVWGGITIVLGFLWVWAAQVRGDGYAAKAFLIVWMIITIVLGFLWVWVFEK